MRAVHGAVKVISNKTKTQTDARRQRKREKKEVPILHSTTGKQKYSYSSNNYKNNEVKSFST